MSKILKYFLISFCFVIVGLLAGFKIKDSMPAGSFSGLNKTTQKLYKSLLFVQSNYVEKVDEDKLVDDAIQGMLNKLDPHSIYIPARELQSAEEELEGSFDGIGVQFNIVEDTIYIETPLAGGPSEKLGILSGDRIVAVDGENVAGVGITNRDVTRLLKGPRGTQVLVTILRRGESELLEFNITRDQIPLNSVDFSYLIDPQTGYIRINRFSETTYDEFKDALGRLIEQGMEKLILDLRGNPGGYMTKAELIADDFLPAGRMIVSTEGRLPQNRQEYKATSVYSAFEKGALIILLDYGSASASEIVAGAVQDNDRGLIVGVRSFGKGLVQIQQKFEDGSAIRLVVSKYYTPSGRCIQKPYDYNRSHYEAEIIERFESGEIFDESKIDHPDSLKYKTRSGRTVWGGGGIYPDVFVPTDTTGGSLYLSKLRRNDLFRRFTVDYYEANAKELDAYNHAAAFLSGFEIDRRVLREFRQFAADKGVEDDPAGFAHSEVVIKNNLKAYLGRRLFNDEGFYPVIHQIDDQLQKALELMPVAERLEQTGQVVLK